MSKRPLAEPQPSPAPSGLLGNVKKDGLYVTPWGKTVDCFVVTDYGEPPLYGIIVGSTANSITTAEHKKISGNKKRDTAKPREIDHVESRWVRIGVVCSTSRERKLESAAIREWSSLLEDERRKTWPPAVLAAIPFGYDNAQSRKAIAEKLHCPPGAVFAQSDAGLLRVLENSAYRERFVAFTVAGEEVRCAMRCGDILGFYRVNADERPLL